MKRAIKLKTYVSFQLKDIIEKPHFSSEWVKK
jgi:hypothetical protein